MKAAWIVLLTGSALSIAQPASAQMPTVAPGAADPSRVVAGNYKVDPAHSQITFTVNHLGFSLYRGIFGDPTGSMTIDPKALANTKVSIEIPINKLVTTSSDLNKHLWNADFFDAAKFPTAKFVSTAVVINGSEAKITGDLTIKGVTKPVVLDARFIGAGKGPMDGKINVGFEATTKIKRTDFGVSYGVPLVPDEVPLNISVAFEKIG